ncbi:MAG: hypothetical protein ACRDL6_06015 [Solirubrobacterales bacterium]
MGPIILAAVLAAALGAGGLAVAKKKRGGKLPRGPYPSLGSCPVFPKASVGPAAHSVGDQSAWNQDISQAPLDPNSANYIAHILAHGGDDTHPDWGYQRKYGFPYAVVGRRQRPVKVNFTAYGDESDKGRYRVPAKAMVEGGQASDGDRHVLAVDRRRCRLYELYRAFFINTKRVAPRLRLRGTLASKPHWNADSGVIWNLRSAALRPDGWTSADAAGLPIFPGLVRFDEAASGQINHALRITVSETQDAWIHPATHCAGASSDPNAPPMGLRLRLRADYEISGFNPHARAIATALKRYGALIADNGSNFYISGVSDRRWTDAIIEPLRHIPGSAFEVVQSASPIHRC